MASSSFTPVALQTGDASQIVSGTLDAARLPTSSEIVTLTNSGTSNMNGILFLRKLGDVVTVTMDGPITHNSTNGPVSASGILPAAYRPGENLDFLVDVSSSGTTRMTIQSSGTVTFNHYSAAFASRNATTTRAATSVSYVVA